MVVVELAQVVHGSGGNNGTAVVVEVELAQDVPKVAAAVVVVELAQDVLKAADHI